jgi:hypothetical protein
LPGGKKETCNQHKLEGYILRRYDRCHCGKVATYVKRGGRRRMCEEHKHNDYISIE